MLVVLRNVNAQVTVGERWVVKQLFVVTDSTIVCGKDLLRKIELYLTLVNAVWRRNVFGAGQPCSSQYSTS